MPKRGSGKGPKQSKSVQSFRHPKAKLILRPEVGVQAQFKKRKPAKQYRYDSSLAPELNWDGQNPAREFGQWLLDAIEKAAALPPPHQFKEPLEFKDAAGRIYAKVLGLQDAVDQLKRLEKPFLNWAGKAERLSFKVPTLPLFVHERLSTKAILETVKGHKRDKQMDFDLFGDPQHPIHEQALKAYEHQNGWVNRLILGDSLVVMNSLLEYEGMAGQVQMVYMDPPYGISYGRNFQPFVRKRGSPSDNDDASMTREPEMVKAYRDTWELGVHSYLTYLRDRLSLCRGLLGPRGSIFVQIGEDNKHLVRGLLDDVFGASNFLSEIVFLKTAGKGASRLDSVYDTLLWYGKAKDQTTFSQLYTDRPRHTLEEQYVWIEAADGAVRKLSSKQLLGAEPIPEHRRRFMAGDLSSQDENETGCQEYEFEGVLYRVPKGRHWPSEEKLARLEALNRLIGVGNSLRYKRYADDFPFEALTNVWDDTVVSGFAPKKLYVVETSSKVVERCMLMTTSPGDLVLDPTCGGGTTATAAEKWGRRWITIDVSRVPLALTRQSILSSTFGSFELMDPAMGPGGGFRYVPRRNGRKADAGGIVQNVTKESLTDDSPPEPVVLVDHPVAERAATRVAGPFVMEATIPTPVDWDADGKEDSGLPEVAEEYSSFVDRMLGILRQSPVLHVGGGETVTLHNLRRPARSLSISAEALVDATAEGQEPTLTDAVDEAEEKAGGRLPLSRKPVAIVIGPENGSVSERLVYEAAREAYGKSYTHLYVLGLRIGGEALEMIRQCLEICGVPATGVGVTSDVTMGDLLKNMRSSQIFSVCGMPDVKLSKLADGKYQVELRGLDTFDPVTMKPHHMDGDDVPAWFLDTDYNGMCFHVCQAFFPRTGAWNSLKKELKGEYDDAVWEHLAGATSAPFEPGEHKTIAVKVIDDRGNELPKFLKVEEAE